MEDDVFRNNKEAAAFLHLQPATLKIWRSRRYGPSFLKIGRKVFYRQSVLEDWLKCRVVETDEDNRKKYYQKSGEKQLTTTEKSE